MKPGILATATVLGGWAAVTLLTSACTVVGPDYQQPALSLPATFQEPAAAAAAATRPAAADWPVRWWTQFQSPALNTLVERALAQNPGIEAGQAALRVAAEAVRAQEGLYQPQVSAGYTFARSKTGSALASPLSSADYVFNLHTLALNVSLTPDVFGLNHRTVESLQAQADSQRHLLEATRASLAANVVVAVVTEAGLREQLQVTEALLRSQQSLLDAQRRLRAAGALGEADVRAQELVVATTDATLPPLQKLLGQQRDLLKNLLGAYPDEVLGATFHLSDLSLPATLPQTLPSSLLERRADLRAAEESLHAASAAIGVARANRLPQVVLGTSVIGQAGTVFADLFRSAGTFWTLAGGIAGPVFDGGTLSARERAARAAYDQAAAMYRQAVLAAFQSVADALVATQTDQEALVRQQRAKEAAERSLAIAQKQKALGDLPAVALLPLEQASLQAQLTLAQIRANQFADVAALCLALGGGWEAMASPTTAALSGTH